MFLFEECNEPRCIHYHAKYFRLKSFKYLNIRVNSRTLHLSRQNFIIQGYTGFTTINPVEFCNRRTVVQSIVRVSIPRSVFHQSYVWEGSVLLLQSEGRTSPLLLCLLGANNLYYTFVKFLIIAAMSTEYELLRNIIIYYLFYSQFSPSETCNLSLIKDVVIDMVISRLMESSRQQRLNPDGRLVCTSATSLTNVING